MVDCVCLKEARAPRIGDVPKGENSPSSFPTRKCVIDHGGTIVSLSSTKPNKRVSKMSARLLESSILSSIF